MGVEYFNPDKRAYLSTRRSPSCAHKLDYHFVFATKYRRKVLTGIVGEMVRDIISQVCAEHNWLLLGLSIQEDHVHVLLGLKPSDQPSKVAHDLKGLTSYRVIGAVPQVAEQIGASQLWGGGYSVETLGRSNAAQVTAYLQTQEAHHTERMISTD